MYITTYNNYYNLNLLDLNFRNNSILSINTRIFANTIKIWKNIYKIAFIRKNR